MFVPCLDQHPRATFHYPRFVVGSRTLVSKTWRFGKIWLSSLKKVTNDIRSTAVWSRVLELLGKENYQKLPS